MRAILILAGLLIALSARSATPEVGKQKLRTLVKLPTVTFQPGWTFDPERGFLLGSGEQDVRAEIAEIRKNLKRDISDAEAYLRLADLYIAINEERNAKTCWTRATELYRKRVELEPENGLLLAGLGRALQGSGSTREAESVLRRAVQIAPGEWKTSVALGRFLDSETRRVTLDRPKLPTVGSASRGSPRAAATATSTSNEPDRLTASQVALAQKWMDEAGVYFDKAVAASPETAEVYFRRGMHLCFKTAVLNQIRAAADDDEDFAGLLDGCFTPESLDDLQRSSRLDSRDYRLMGGTVLFEIYMVSAQKGQVDWTQFSLGSLPEKSQRHFRETVARLENLGQNPETRVASGALEVLGILQGSVLRETDRSVANLRRSLALQPARTQAWDALVAALARAGRYDELLAACEEQAKQKESTRSRLLLAKAFEKLRQWDNSEEQVRMAVNQEPNDFNASLSLASLLMRRSRGNPQALSEANEWITRAQNVLGRMPRDRRSPQQAVDFALTRGIYLALTDDLNGAKEWIRAVLERDREDKFAQEVLAAMDF